MTDEELVLHAEGLSKRSASLFDELQSDEALRDEFIRNPTKVVSEKVTGKPLPAAQASAGNRFLFSLLANDEFRTWMKVYNRRLLRDRPSEEERLKDFAQAIIRYGDENLMASLAELAASGYGIPGITNVAYQCVSGACTPTAQAQDAKYTQNFEASTSNTGLGEHDPLINPAVFRSMTEHLITRAKELAMMGELRNLGAKIQ